MIVLPNAKDQEAKTGPAIQKVPKHDFSSGGSRTTLMKQDSCEVASDYLENFAEEIKDSDFLDEICDLQRSPVSEEILTSSDSCSKITVSCSSHRETKRGKYLVHFANQDFKKKNSFIILSNWLAIEKSEKEYKIIANKVDLSRKLLSSTLLICIILFYRTS